MAEEAVKVAKTTNSKKRNKRKKNYKELEKSFAKLKIVPQEPSSSSKHTQQTTQTTQPENAFFLQYAESLQAKDKNDNWITVTRQTRPGLKSEHIAITSNTLLDFINNENKRSGIKEEGTNKTKVKVILGNEEKELTIH